MQYRKTNLYAFFQSSKRSSSDIWGRNDGSIKVVIPNDPILSSERGDNLRNINVGDYVVVKVWV
jgi:hypothetical protein